MAVDFSGTALKAGIDAFGKPVIYQPKTSPQFNVSGVFDEVFCDDKVIDGMLITTTTPALGVRLFNFPSPPKQDDHILINEKIYIVREVRPDGQGGAVLMLNLDSEYIWP